MLDVPPYKLGYIELDGGGETKCLEVSYNYRLPKLPLTFLTKDAEFDHLSGATLRVG